MELLAARIQRSFCGAACHVASYDAFMEWLCSLPESLLPSRFDTEETTAADSDEVVVTRHEITLRRIRIANAPQITELDGTVTLLTPNICRLRGLSYEIAVFGEYEYERTRGSQTLIFSLVLTSRGDRGFVLNSDDASSDASSIPSDAALDDETHADEFVEGDAVVAHVAGYETYTERVDDSVDAQALADIRLVQYFAGVAREDDERFGRSLFCAVAAVACSNGARCVTEATARDVVVERRHELQSSRTVAAVLRDVTMRLSNSELERHKERHTLLLGSIPLMVGSTRCATKLKGVVGDAARSTECEMDRGGFFIMGGTERVIPISERREPSTVLVHSKRVGKRVQVTAELVSMSGTRSYTLYVRTMKPDARSRLCDVTIALPFARPVPALLLLRALGVETDEDLYTLIVPHARRGGELDMHVRAMLVAAAAVASSRHAALAILRTRLVPAAPNKKNALRKILDMDLLPHVGTSVGSTVMKSGILAHMVLRVLEVATDITRPDDRDGSDRRVLELCGMLLTKHVGQHISRIIPNEMRLSIRRQVDGNRPPQIQRTISTKRLGEVLRTVIVSGRTSDGAGVSEVLPRTNVKSTASMLSRSSAGIGSDKTKQIAPRKLNPSQYGVMCPFETPEGQSIGLLKNLTVLAFPSGLSGIPMEFWVQMLTGLGLSTLKSTSDGDKVFVDGSWVGNVAQPRIVATALRAKRRRGVFSAYVSVSVCAEGLFVCTAAGRIMRPLFVVEAGRVLFDASNADASPSALVALGVLEFIDPRESACMLIASRQADLADGYPYTHCELHPVMLFGMMVACMPFPDHNQSPRNVYYAAMGKQSVGVSSYSDRMDTLAYTLHYPQRALVSSFVERTMQEDIAGQNAVVAIMTFNGFNQEDSVILSQGSIDRGFGHSSTYHTYRADEKASTGGHGERICNPDLEVGVTRKKLQAYSNLDQDGVVPVGVRVVAQQDVIIGKVVPISNESCVDSSVVVRCDGVVDKVLITSNADSRMLVKVRVRSYRQPQIGDKFASRHGQKGVCGMKYNQEDMPWTRDGISPDLIMNPHAIPSRMTIGHMKEALLAKRAALDGKAGDGTAFGNESVESIGEALHRLGYQRHGEEVMYCGATGVRLGRKIFVGPGPWYQRLKHQVEDKLHSRARGPTQAVTRQPSAGRSRDGALRLGEMERDCLISHGTSALLLERLMYSSDVSMAPVCSKCGQLAVLNERRGINICRGCCSSDCVVNVRMPYPTKALIQELLSVGIDMRLELKGPTPV